MLRETPPVERERCKLASFGLGFVRWSMMERGAWTCVGCCRGTDGGCGQISMIYRSSGAWRGGAVLLWLISTLAEERAAAAVEVETTWFRW
jgi:hypothetical protein